MSLYCLKPRFQSHLLPLARQLHTSGVTANAITLTALAGSVALGGLLVMVPDSSGLFVFLTLWLPIRMVLNAIDGMIARKFGQASPFGVYLNELSDVISDAALFLPFAFLPGAHFGLVIAAAGLSFLTEMTGVLGVVVGASRRYDGPLGKSDRAFVLGVLGLLIGLGYSHVALATPVWSAVALLAAATVVQRVRRGLAERTPT